MQKDCKRRFVRFEFDASISVFSGPAKHLGRAINVGMGGMRVRTFPPPPVGSRVVLSFSVPDTPQICEIPCIVRWSDKRYGTGLQFEQLRPADIIGLGKLKEMLIPCDDLPSPTSRPRFRSR